MIEKKVADSKTIFTQIVMPNDTNPMHNLMGGNLMSWMDVVASICAGKHTESLVVTASVDHVTFTKPINLGDVVTLEASVTRAFNTSIEIYVEVFKSDIKGKNSERCNDAYFTFVALTDDGKPHKVPGLLPLSKHELEMYNSANRRRQLRLILSGRMHPDDATELKNLFIPLSKVE